MNVTFTPELNYRSDSQGLHLIQIRCTRSRIHKRISTGVSIPKDNWDEKRLKVKRNYALADEYNRIIHSFIKKLTKIYAELLERNEVDLNDIVREFNKPTSTCFFEFAYTYKIAEIRASNKLGTLRRYESVIEKFKEYTKAPFPVQKVTYELLKQYEQYMAFALENSRDTISSNLSVIRTIINEAIKHGIYDRANPFDQLKLKYTDNSKEKLTKEELAKFITAPLPDIPSLHLARDFFVACFLAEGCRGGDMVTMNTSNFNNGILEYAQHKTGKRMIMSVSGPLQEIFMKYTRDNSYYLFPMLNNKDKVNEIVINSKLTYINKYLKEVCKYSGIFKKITTHCARHTFTDIALAMTNDNIYQVQQLLGHQSVKTTEIYARNRVNGQSSSITNLIWIDILGQSCKTQ